MSMKVVIIGAGPGGYVSAIRCAQLGMQVTIIEKYKSLGGTCLNVGCIPSKALLDSSEHYHQAIHQFASHGIEVGKAKFDFAKMISRKEDVIMQNTKGIEYLMKKNKIEVINGLASFISDHKIKVSGNTSVTEIDFDYCVIATGSKPNIPPSFNYNKDRIISSTEALSLTEFPKELIIVGAGVIGLELGSVYARLGAKVTVIEYLDRILPGMDLDCAKELQKTLKGIGIEFILGQSVQSVIQNKKRIQLVYKDKSKDSDHQLEADYCLVSIGRKAYTDGLELNQIDLQLDEKGRIPVNENCQTKVKNIFAIGDVIHGPMLAHKAEEEGVFVAEYLSGQKPKLNHNLIPGVVYTWPEMASVGMTEDSLKEKNIKYKIGKFPFKALGRARASMDMDGFVKILADADSDEILGVHIVGARAADLIMEAAALMEFKSTAEDMSRICHPHPTFSEGLKEAALDATGKRAIHM